MMTLLSFLPCLAQFLTEAQSNIIKQSSSQGKTRVESQGFVASHPKTSACAAN